MEGGLEEKKTAIRKAQNCCHRQGVVSDHLLCGVLLFFVHRNSEEGCKLDIYCKIIMTVCFLTLSPSLCLTIDHQFVNT